MTTEAKLKYALKEMMLSKPLEEINVTLLCERCGCRRQTFYYHYQDIYDLLSAILLNESIPGLDESTNLSKAFSAMLSYTKKNLTFIKSTYNSSAHDLIDDLFYGKLMGQVFAIIKADASSGLTMNESRIVARRLSKFVSDEYGFRFKDGELTAASFERHIKKFNEATVTTVYPALIEAVKKEHSKK